MCIRDSHTTNPATNENQNYTTSRLQSFASLLRDDFGLSSTELTLWNRPGSGKIKIYGQQDYNTVRNMPFVCPSTANHRIPGGDRDGFAAINWLQQDGPSDWLEIVGDQCASNPKLAL